MLSLDSTWIEWMNLSPNTWTHEYWLTCANNFLVQVLLNLDLAQSKGFVNDALWPGSLSYTNDLD